MGINDASIFKDLNERGLCDFMGLSCQHVREGCAYIVCNLDITSWLTAVFFLIVVPYQVRENRRPADQLAKRGYFTHFSQRCCVSYVVDVSSCSPWCWRDQLKEVICHVSANVAAYPRCLKLQSMMLEGNESMEKRWAAAPIPKEAKGLASLGVAMSPQWACPAW